MANRDASDMELNQEKSDLYLEDNWHKQPPSEKLLTMIKGALDRSIASENYERCAKLKNAREAVSSRLERIAAAKARAKRTAGAVVADELGQSYRKLAGDWRTQPLTIHLLLRLGNAMDWAKRPEIAEYELAALFRDAMTEVSGKLEAEQQRLKKAGLLGRILG